MRTISIGQATETNGNKNYTAHMAMYIMTVSLSEIRTPSVSGLSLQATIRRAWWPQDAKCRNAGRCEHQAQSKMYDKVRARQMNRIYAQKRSHRSLMSQAVENFQKTVVAKLVLGQAVVT